MEPITFTVNPIHISFVLGCLFGQLPLSLLIANTYRQYVSAKKKGEGLQENADG